MSKAPASGIILAGGLARRMGGGDKPLKEIAGKPILAHVIARLTPQCTQLVLNANGDPARFASFGLPVIADDVPDFAGPLAGILAGLDWAAANARDCECAVGVAADTPFIPRDLVQRLQAARVSEACDIAVAASGGRTHPVIALWPVALRSELRRALVEEGERKIDRFTARYQVAEVSWPSEPYDPFFNVNEAGDIEVAGSIAAIAGCGWASHSSKASFTLPCGHVATNPAEISMTAEQNKALVRRFYTEIDNGNVDAMNELVAENYVDHNPPPFPGLPSGREGLKQAFRLFLKATPGRHQIEDQIAEGDKVVTRLTSFGRHEGDLPGAPRTGNELKITSITIHRIENGRLAEKWGEKDLLGFLVQIGVMKPPS